jgi:hypothetical protein
LYEAKRKGRNRTIIFSWDVCFSKEGFAVFSQVDQVL